MSFQKEEDWIKALKAGNKEAFDALLNEFKDRVFNTCLGFVRNQQAAEDLAQEVFIEVYLSLDQFEGRSKLSTWIYRIAVTKSLEHLRHAKRKKRFAPITRIFQGDQGESEWLPAHSHPGLELENKELGEQIFKVIDNLPENQKTAFVMHVIEGYSYQEIADILESSVSSIESLIFRARQKLRKKLDHLNPKRKK